MKDIFNENIRNIEVYMLAQFIDVIEIISKYNTIEEVKNDIDNRIKTYFKEIEKINKTKDLFSINLNNKEIDFKIKKCKKIYQEDKEYKYILEKLNSEYTNLMNKIEYQDKKELEEIKKLVSEKNNYDIHLSYKLGLVEGLKIKNKCT